MSVQCIITMLESINANGVYANAYDDFVEYIVQNSSPSNNRIGVTFASSVTETVIFIVILILVLVFIAFAIMVILLVHRGYISAITAICAIVVGAALLVVYYVSCRSFTLSSTYEIMPLFQETLVDTALYTLNSIFRNALYIALCQ